MFRSKKKKYKITLNERGIHTYDFTFKDELDIYSCLCLVPGYEKIKKRINAQFVFSSYDEWKNYIQKKYINYDKKKLLEFSRYLNQRLRNLKPGKEVNSLFIPIILALIVEEFMLALAEITEISNLLGNFKWGILIFYIAMIILFAILAIMLFNIISPFWKDNLEENFVTDYKEIIDEMIEQLGNKDLKGEKEK